MDEVERAPLRVGQAVRSMETDRSLGDDVGGEKGWKLDLTARCLAEELLERDALDELHHEVRQAFVFAEIERANHVWMLDSRRDPRLTPKRCDRSLGEVGLGHELQRDERAV